MLGMEHLLVDLYQVCLYDAPGSRLVPPGVGESQVTEEKNSKFFFSETGRRRAFICGMQHLPLDLYQVCPYDVTGVKIGPAPGSQVGTFNNEGRL